MRQRFCYLSSLSLSLFLLNACLAKRTDASSPESFPLGEDLSLEGWVKACEAELANPATGTASRQELVDLAGTDDCAGAYPAIRHIFETYMSAK